MKEETWLPNVKHLWFSKFVNQLNCKFQKYRILKFQNSTLKKFKILYFWSSPKFSVRLRTSMLQLEDVIAHLRLNGPRILLAMCLFGSLPRGLELLATLAGCVSWSKKLSSHEPSLYLDGWPSEEFCWLQVEVPPLAYTTYNLEYMQYYIYCI